MDKSDAGASGVCPICGHTPDFCPHGTAAVNPSPSAGTGHPLLFPEGVPIPGCDDEVESKSSLKRINTMALGRNIDLQEMIDELKVILVELVNTRVEGVDLYPHAVTQHGVDEAEDWFSIEDEKAPFFTEAYLYSLIGKDAARTILSLIRRIQVVLRTDDEDLV